MIEACPLIKIPSQISINMTDTQQAGFGTGYLPSAASTENIEKMMEASVKTFKAASGVVDRRRAGEVSRCRSPHG